MNRLFDRIFGSTVDAPLLVTLLILLLSGAALLGYYDPDRVTSLLKPRAEMEAVPEPAPPQPKDDKQKTEIVDETPKPKPQPQIPDVDAVSLTDSDVILVVKSKQFFTPEGAAAIRDVVAQLDALPYVRDILWMDRAPVLNLFGFRESLFPKARASQRQFDEAREAAVNHPLIGGQLLSRDGETILLLIKFDWLFVTDDADCTENLKLTAAQAASKYEDVDFEYMVTGKVPSYLTFMESQEKNRFKYQMIGYGTILAMAMILFRGFRAVLIVSLAPAIGVFWTLGILHYFNFQDNPFNDIILPVLLSLVGLTDGVHLMVEIRKLRSQGRDVRDAARTGICRVGLACALTSITTAIGFGSLSLAHHEIVREFGICCVIGVLLTFLSVVLTIPLLCSTRLGRNIHKGHEKGLIDRNLNRISGLITFILNRSKGFAWAAIACTILFSMISLTLRPDERRANALPQHSEAVLAIKHMDEAFGGLEMSSVRINWDDQIDSDSPEVLTVIMQIDDLLDAEPLIGSPISIRNFIDVLPGSGEPQDRMPLLQLLPASLKRAFYEPERRRAEVNFRVQDLGIARYGPVFERIEAGLETIQSEHPHFNFDLTGSAVWRWENLYQIVIDLAASLGSATFIIFLVLAVAYRSLRIGLISIIPNLFPLAVTGTFLVIYGQSLEIASVCAFTVCLGIAVDDTIHFLTRYREESRRKPQNAAIAHAFTETGTALIMTTIVLLVGFTTVLLSDMRDQRIFAAMGALTIGSALFADLIFLPALLSYFMKDSHEEESTELLEPDKDESELSPVSTAERTR
ncbi:efflux RND transporter permease subunit [Rubinisphaera sp.]|uniref:efflux RND transporter permease subunit n=1 Tax=Rubinisphaera sp. TaxID=2024857 RepID=UPI000C0FE144|nr:efflux RND transporter permease subunit [Rubinisphaera sp.]MBV08987.1 RND transporter [Rubinisphaera sp.]|tara:strand:- start:4631 stop:7036 length:2406 start_codon:yes stop_codon:yes gene_type:complete